MLHDISRAGRQFRTVVLDKLFCRLCWDNGELTIGARSPQDGRVRTDRGKSWNFKVRFLESRGHLNSWCDIC